MNPTINNYPIYNLSNSHFKQVEIITTKNVSLKGQFVQFKVAEDNIQYIYPSEQFCFLLVANNKEFWETFNTKNGAFNEFPTYIIQLHISEITKIIIEPLLTT